MPHWQLICCLNSGFGHFNMLHVCLISFASKSADQKTRESVKKKILKPLKFILQGYVYVFVFLSRLSHSYN